MRKPRTLRAALPGLWRATRRFWPYTRRHRTLLAGSFLALFAGVAFRALEPWPLKLVFDGVLAVDPTGTVHVGPFLDGMDPTLLLALAAASLVAIIGLRALATYYHKVGFALVGSKVLAEVRGAFYRHLQCLSLSFHHNARRGDLIVRVIGDIGLLRDVAVTALMPMLASTMVLLLMAGLMLWIHWKLALLVLVTLPLYALPTVRLGRRIRHVSQKQRRQEGAMASTAAESLGAIRVVKALSLEDTFAESFSGQNNKSLKDGVKARRLAARLQGSVQVMTAASTALVLWYGTHLVLRGTLSPGDLLVFLSYLKAMFRPMSDFAKYASRLAKASAAADRVLDLFDREPDLTDHPEAVPAPSFRGAVRFERVTFGYTPGHPVLRDVTLEIAPGERVAIVGPSGSGKSTLVSLLPRLYDPDRGQVCIDGRDIRAYTLASLRAQISVVLQDNVLFAASVRDNIAYGAPDVSFEAIQAAARLANAHDFIQRMPEGYDTILGERGVTLSAGQRQRLAIARAAVRDAPLLVLDEPTTGLDEENERAVVEALERLARGRTTFLVTHDLRQAARCDRIVYLEGGVIRACGTHAELMRQGGRYATWFTLETAPLNPTHAPEEPHVVS
ncbi:MAG: protein-tyrosine-phosphatase [Rhodothermaceae bacterium]|nr:MAG: protein-tyrosine-phosphatase [Rhodothermaceae bacterium]